MHSSFYCQAAKGDGRNSSRAFARNPRKTAKQIRADKFGLLMIWQGLRFGSLLSDGLGWFLVRSGTGCSIFDSPGCAIPLRNRCACLLAISCRHVRLRLPLYHAVPRAYLLALPAFSTVPLSEYLAKNGTTLATWQRLGERNSDGPTFFRLAARGLHVTANLTREPTEARGVEAPGQRTAASRLLRRVGQPS